MWCRMRLNATAQNHIDDAVSIEHRVLSICVYVAVAAAYSKRKNQERNGRTCVCVCVLLLPEIEIPTKHTSWFAKCDTDMAELMLD